MIPILDRYLLREWVKIFLLAGIGLPLVVIEVEEPVHGHQLVQHEVNGRGGHRSPGDRKTAISDPLVEGAVRLRRGNHGQVFEDPGQRLEIVDRFDRVGLDEGQGDPGPGHLRRSAQMGGDVAGGRRDPGA